jgi:hypothetical protein
MEGDGQVDVAWAGLMRHYVSRGADIPTAKPLSMIAGQRDR